MTVAAHLGFRDPIGIRRDLQLLTEIEANRIGYLL